MQRKPFGIMYLIIAQARLACNLRFQNIPHEILGLLALNHQLAALVTDHIHSIALERKLRISHIIMRPRTRGIRI